MAKEYVFKWQRDVSSICSTSSAWDRVDEPNGTLELGVRMAVDDQAFYLYWKKETTTLVDVTQIFEVRKCALPKVGLFGCPFF